MTFEVQQNRWDQLIRRVGGSIGPGSRVSESLSELFPVLDVERVPGELLLLGGTRLCWGGTTFAPGGVLTSRVQLFNPADSGALVTPTLVNFQSDTAQRIRIAVTETALLTGTGLERFRDTRLPLLGRPIAQIRTEGTVALTDAIVQFDVAADENIILEDKNELCVLKPGAGYEFGGNTAATRIFVNFWWRERIAEKSELLEGG